MNVIEAGLYTRLTGYSALTSVLSTTTAIYNAVAAPAAALSYVIFQHTGGGFENITPSELVNTLYIVKGLADDPTEAGTIQGHIKGALHGVTLTVSGYTNFYTRCETEINYTEQMGDGSIVYHRGYTVRIRLDD